MAKLKTPPVFEEGKPGFWREIRQPPDEATSWRNATTVAQALENLERTVPASDEIAFRLLAIHRYHVIGQGTYQRRHPTEFSVFSEDTIVQGLFQPGVTTYLEERAKRLRACEEHPCDFPGCHETVTGNDVARVITLADDGEEPRAFYFYACAVHYNYVAEAKIALTLQHHAAVMTFSFRSLLLDPPQRERERLHLPKRVALPPDASVAQRLARKKLETRAQIWMREAYDLGRTHQEIAVQEPEAQIAAAERIYGLYVFPQAKRKKMFSQELLSLGGWGNEWFAHFLEGVHRVEARFVGGDEAGTL